MAQSSTHKGGSEGIGAQDIDNDRNDPPTPSIADPDVRSYPPRVVGDPHSTPSPIPGGHDPVSTEQG